MNFFRRKTDKKANASNPQASQSVMINDATGIFGESSFLGENGSKQVPVTQESITELVAQIQKLKDQNLHLNKYIVELSKQNEQLQTRLSDMKVTLQENKAMMEEFMAG